MVTVIHSILKHFNILSAHNSHGVTEVNIDLLIQEKLNSHSKACFYNWQPYKEMHRI